MAGGGGSINVLFVFSKDSKFNNDFNVYLKSLRHTIFIASTFSNFQNIGEETVPSANEK